MDGRLAFFFLFVFVAGFSRGALGQSTSACTTTPSGSPMTCTCSCTSDSSSFPFSCGGKSFFYKFAPSSYSIASATCAERGGRLVTLKNKKVNDCVEKVLRDAGLQRNNFWIGLVRKAGGNPDFMWSDATPLKSDDFSNFAPGEPHNILGNQNCVYLWGSQQKLKWDDWRCNGNIDGYICESLKSVDDN